ncbi:MAG: NAD(+) diphosphatase [Victivallales bacterium]|nr:NAD(+) diphosphatase [Victivallales bacterium]
MQCFTPSTRHTFAVGSELPPSTKVCLFLDNEVLLTAASTLPCLADLPCLSATQGLVCGALDNAPCAAFPAPGVVPPDLLRKSVRQAIWDSPPPLRQAICRAKLHLNWLSREQYCGKCGAKLHASPLDLSQLCPVCGEHYYPQISPAVITAILDQDGRILLAHNRNFRPGIFSLIAGFVEAGESAEETVVREVHEEIGVEVSDIRYFGSQTWPFPNSLMLGFTARYAGGVPTPDGTEIESAAWFTKDTLPSTPSPGSIAYSILTAYRNGGLPGSQN